MLIVDFLIFPTCKQIDAVEDILNGGEGDKFKATANIVLHTQKSVDKDGKISSAACSVQWRNIKLFTVITWRLTNSLKQGTRIPSK